MTMRVSFKVSKIGARFRPKPKPETPTVLEDDDVDALPEIAKHPPVIANTKPSVYYHLFFCSISLYVM